MSGSGAQPTYVFEGFRLDAQRRVLSRADGQPIPLAPKVFDTLLYLVERPGQLVDKRELLEAVWPHVVVEENNLNQAISGLRRVLGETPGTHRFIVTEPGRGYRLVASVRVLSAADELPAQPVPAPSSGDNENAAARTPIVKSAWLTYTIAAVIGALALVGAGAWLSDRDEPPSIAADAPPQDDGAAPAVLANSVAVLPLANLSPEAEYAAYADAMHAEIIHQLNNLRNVNVIAREAVLQNPANRSLAERARDFGVQLILTGTFQYANGRIRVIVQLVDPATNRNVWNEDYEESFEDVLAVQADIATRVAAALGAELTVVERQRMETRPTTSPEAYASYFLALNHQYSGRRIDALRQFERAVAIDPTFSLAHGKLALLYALALSDDLSGPAVSMAPSEWERRVSQNAKAALNLDPDSAAAYAALGTMNVMFWRWSDAEAAFASALALNPNDLETLHLYAQFQSARGQYREALPMAQRIVDLSPPTSNSESLLDLWVAHVYSGNVNAALGVLERALAIDPANLPARINLGFVNARRGDTEGAALAFRLVEDYTDGRRSPTTAAGLAYGYSRVGYADEARALFQEIQSVADQRSIGAGTWALAYLAMDEDEQAVEWLDKLLAKIANHEADAAWFNSMIIKHNITGDPVLEQPRFRDLRTKIRGS